MSCSASSARPPLTIDSSRARANSAPSPGDDNDNDNDGQDSDGDSDSDGDNHLSRAQVPETIPRTLLPAMFTSVVALFSSKKQVHRVYNLADSQTSSMDSLSLPLPASPHRTSFGAEVWQEDGHFRTGGRPTARESLPWWSGSLSTLAPMLLILLIFPLSAILVLAGLFSLPITASFPRTISELSNLGRELQAYSDSGFQPMAHVLGVLAITAIWKHAWSIPGSVLLNVLAGVLLSPAPATLLMTSLTAVGSVLSSLLATPLAPVISQFFPKALTLTRNALEGGDTLTAPPKDKAPGWVRLSVLRLIGVVPWSGINIACGVTGVPLTDCLLGALIGTLPWTAVTCQVGDIMQTVATASTSSSDPETLASLLHSPTVVFKLALLTFLSLIPILARDRLRSLLGRSIEEEELRVESKIAQDAKGQRWWRRTRRSVSSAMEMDTRAGGTLEKDAAPR